MDRLSWAVPLGPAQAHDSPNRAPMRRRTSADSRSALTRLGQAGEHGGTPAS